MRIGILAYATDTGLGYQTRDYVKFLEPTKVMVVDLSRYNMMPVHKDWYPDAWRWVYGIPTDQDCEDFVKDLDVILVGETPLNYRLFSAAKEQGVKTIQAYNFEFIDYIKHPEYTRPDVLAGPTTWNINRVKSMANGSLVTELPVPVNRAEIPLREITECKTFVHIVGRPAIYDRNGTLAFLEAAKRLGRDFKYKIYLQRPTDERARGYFKPVSEKIDELKELVDLEVIENVSDRATMYQSGDVMVIPRRYGGLCLPMQEALSAGMPVIMTKISPNDTRLPIGWLCEAEKTTTFTANVEIDHYEPNIDSLVFVMKQFTLPNFAVLASRQANRLAMDLSWETLKPQYLNLMEQIVNGN